MMLRYLLFTSGWKRSPLQGGFARRDLSDQSAAYHQDTYLLPAMPPTQNMFGFAKHGHVHGHVQHAQLDPVPCALDEARLEKLGKLREECQHTIETCCRHVLQRSCSVPR